MSSLFLMGAGASHGSGPCDPYPPPLGRNLFEAMRAEGGITTSFSDDLVAVFQDFEAGMAILWETRNVDVPQFLREMAAYFLRFEPRLGNHYLELLSILRLSRVQPIFVTLNYDLLLDLAIQQSGSRIAYVGEPTIPAGNILLLKIHGSCHFLPDTNGKIIHMTNNEFTSNTGAILEGPVKFARSVGEVQQFLATQIGVAPIVAMYARKKRVLFCPRFIKVLQQAWIRRANDATRIFVIGAAVYPDDDHVWGTLAAARAPLYYVGGDHAKFENWAGGTGRKNAHVLAPNFKAALPEIRRLLAR